MNLARTLKETERSLMLSVMRSRVRVGAALWPQRTVEELAQRFFRTERPAPERLSFATPAAIESVPVPDGTITTYRWEAAASAPVALLVHGWNGWAQQLESFVAPLRARGFAVLAFDHVAHGRSAGVQTSLPGMIRSVEHVLAQEPNVRAVIAHSLGAAAVASVLASSRRQLDGAVLVAPPSDPRPYLQAMMRMLAVPRALLPQIQQAAERHAGVPFAQLTADPSRIRRIRTPLLVVHDANDEEVPIANGYQYVAAEQARMLVSDGLGHRRVLRDAHVVAQAVDFVTPQSPPRPAVRPAVSAHPRAGHAAHAAVAAVAAADAECCAR